MQLFEIMTRDLFTLAEEDALEQADALLARARVRHLPILRGRTLVGLVTHRDLLRECRRKDAKTGAPLKVRDAMSTDVVTLPPEASVRNAIRLMVEGQYGCIPIVDAKNALLGIVTETDLLRVADEWMARLDREEEAAEYEA